MKMKYLMLCGALFLGTAALTSCSEDESYDVYGYDYTRAYFNVAKQTTNGMIVSTPVGLVTSLDAKVVVKTTSAATSDTKVALAIDNSVVDEYNKEHGTSYLPVPAGALELSSNVVSMKAGELVTEDTVDVKINEEVAKNMNCSDGYLAAVVITSADNGVRPSSNAAVTYIHLGYSESSVNDDATELLGQACNLSDVSSVWTCLSATGCGLDKSGFSSLFESYSWYRRWKFSSKEPKAEFVVDLGDIHKISAFNFSCGVMKGATVSISTDNSSWTTLGNTAEHKPFSVRDGWDTISWYVLYASMSARYVKVSIDLDMNHSDWEWMQYGYASIDGFNLAYAD